MPAQQIRGEVVKVVLQALRDRVAVRRSDVGQVEGEVDTGRGAGSAPVAGQPMPGGLLDHPAGHRMTPDPLPARGLVGRQDGSRGGGGDTGGHR
ncbi:hypothetical protein [Peterkaempfera sp. SMS 1(5)a]|uniref:hypothetical protein n=1 Tax=Peterkaempfera podocarpi TaxID=3232308 RepID=UPI003671A640